MPKVPDKPVLVLMVEDSEAESQRVLANLKKVKVDVDYTIMVTTKEFPWLTPAEMANALEGIVKFLRGELPEQQESE